MSRFVEIKLINHKIKNTKILFLFIFLKFNTFSQLYLNCDNDKRESFDILDVRSKIKKIKYSNFSTSSFDEKDLFKYQSFEIIMDKNNNLVKKTHSYKITVFLRLL